ncbi:hypothetical protein [Couchioplanes caeruleus]|uniref:Uncharacterized protein n=2 Tax=Couchioplanes caeruleus TaxID=56438 RepID=A0A1K0FCI9_9ACTN|nr:hypothetical protein [Couchioplanes caeruleus]OJF10549.1 hypothetical protein BG844_31545 [Couchioplanes caeruleus subsp. caeruleus]
MPAGEATPTGRRYRIGARPTVAGVVGAVLGLLPHLAHHIGWFAGTALIAGAGGTALFAAVGLAAMAPMLLRLHRRFRWWGPGIALAGYALMFTLSSTLIGPALRSGMGEPAPHAPAHTEHRPSPGSSGHGHQPR